MAIDPNSLPRDAETLRKIVVDLAEQLDRSLAEQNKYQTLLRELLEAQRNRKSEQLSKEQLALFEAAWQARNAEGASAASEDDDDLDGDSGAGPKPDETQGRKRGGRQPLARHLNRERIRKLLGWTGLWVARRGKEVLYASSARLGCFLETLRSISASPYLVCRAGGDRR